MWRARWRVWCRERHQGPIPPYAYVETFSGAVRCLLCSRQAVMPRWAAQKRVAQNEELRVGPCPMNPGWAHVWTPRSDPQT